MQHRWGGQQPGQHGLLCQRRPDQPARLLCQRRRAVRHFRYRYVSRTTTTILVQRDEWRIH